MSETITQLQRFIGKTGYLRREALEPFVKIHDVKLSYGQVRLLVKPVCGRGEMWIEQNRIEIGSSEVRS